MKLMKRIWLLPLFALVCCCSRTKVSVSDLRDGDLLFVVNGDENNITRVTNGVNGLGIDHVAIYSEGNVIEAIPVKGVIESPLDSFLVRLSENESVMAGRVIGFDVVRSLENARGYIGLPYDDIFMPGDSAVYCSELVQLAFVSGAAAGVHNSVFGTVPMSFSDSTGSVTEFWTDFYAGRGIDVPEGKPGTNPGQISRDPNVMILGTLSFPEQKGYSD